MPKHERHMPQNPQSNKPLDVHRSIRRSAKQAKHEDNKPDIAFNPRQFRQLRSDKPVTLPKMPWDSER